MTDVHRKPEYKAASAFRAARAASILISRKVERPVQTFDAGDKVFVAKDTAFVTVKRPMFLSQYFGPLWCPRLRIHIMSLFLCIGLEIKRHPCKKSEVRYTNGRITSGVSHTVTATELYWFV